VEKREPFVIYAAGGNATAIVVLDKPQSRAWYAERGKELDGFRGAEQVGFLIPSISHFEMSGGEFCGNGGRAAALLLARLTGEDTVCFSMSGCARVEARILWTTPSDKCKAVVEGTFFDMSYQEYSVSLADGISATVVDFGNIAHVVLAQPFRNDEAWYRAEHKRIIQAFDSTKSPAVGVVWTSPTKDGVRIDPVVLVRDTDTFYYETACGSGSMAAAVVDGMEYTFVYQPSGEFILVARDGRNFSLRSRMEITYIPSA